MPGGTLPSDYFERLYAGDPDPWRISAGWYEERKRALVMAALPQRKYSVGIEPGCGNGELTALLAARCERLVAFDGAERAVEACRARVAGLDNVEVRLARVPYQWPEEMADLVVLSEIGYYLAPADLDAVATRAIAGLRSGGTLLAVHWRRPAPDYPLGGDDVHAHLFGRSALARTGGYADEDVRIDIFAAIPPPARSVAQVAGVVS
ncbi:MAG: nodulation S family protein [Actinomycetota bacterium]|nr:nodulation S family protein [Actinomycetota bacterium]